MAKGVEFPPETRARFLAALALTGHVGKAAETAGVAVPTLYQWRKTDPRFATDWDEAKHVRREVLAAKAWDVVEHVMDDGRAETKDRLAAAKVVIDKTEPAQASERGTTDDGIAEAIDRFTTLVGTLAARNVQSLDRDAAGGGARDALGEGTS